MNRLVSILLLTFIASCSRSLSDKEVVGVYEFRSDPWRQEVRVSPNGKYINALYRNNLLVWSDQGEWIYDEVGEERGITFNDFRFGMPDSYKFDIPEYASHTHSKGYWFVVPEKSFAGTKRLCFDPDLDRCFEVMY